MSLLGALVAVILATKLLGEIAQRAGQPAVLGELLAGVLLGASVLGVLDPNDPAFHAFAQLGVLILLFEIGLHTDLRSLRRVGTTAATVAGVGMIVPFVAGIIAAKLLGYGLVASLVAGAALTATSIGISSRLLADLGHLNSPEGEIVLGAAVIDDLVGLILLSVIAAVAAGGTVSVLGIVRVSVIAIGFVVAALALGSLAIPPLFKLVERVRMRGTLGLVALAFALLLALGAEQSGSAAIIGAFAAGVILHPTPQRSEIERNVASLGIFFVPIFFACVGASVELRALATPAAIAAGIALSAVGIAGKVAAGYAPWRFEGNKLLVGTAMIPRGEVGLIFAQMGLASAAISADLFGALMLMVAVTTFVTPLMLARAGRSSASRPGGVRTFDGGIDALVAGPRHTPRSTMAVGRRNKDG